MKIFLIYYTSENKTFYFLIIIKDYKIINKLRYFIINNNATNDKILQMFFINI
jgi:hypothetical protein